MTRIPRIAVERLYNQTKDIIEEKTNIIDILITLMTIVDTYRDLSGNQKKQVVMDVITNMPIDNSIKEILPTVIDTLISLDKNEFLIKVKKTFKNCCK